MGRGEGVIFRGSDLGFKVQRLRFMLDDRPLVNRHLSLSLLTCTLTVPITFSDSTYCQLQAPVIGVTTLNFQKETNPRVPTPTG